MSALATAETMTEKQPSPLSIRLESDLETRLEAFAQRVGKKRHAIASAAVRLGVEVLEQDEKRFFDALIAAEKAKAEAAIQGLEEKKESLTKKLARKTNKTRQG